MPKYKKLSLFKSSAIFLFVFLYLFLYLPTPVRGAVKTWDGGGGDNLATTAENWDDDLAPVAGDTLIFNSLSVKDCTFDVTDDIGSFDIQTGYTGVITLANNIAITGGGSLAVEDGTFDANDFNISTTNVTSTGSTTTIIYMGSGTWTTAGSVLLTNTSLTLHEETSTLSMTAAGTLTMATGLELYNLTFGSIFPTTFIIESDIIVNNTFDNYGNENTINGPGLNIKIAGNFTHSSGSAGLLGTATLYFNGTTTYEYGTIGFVAMPIVIDGDVAIGFGVFTENIGGNLTYISGTFNPNGRAVVLAGNATWDTEGMTFEDFDTKDSGHTLTLASDMTVEGDFLSVGTSHIITINGSGNRFILQGDLIDRGAISGNATFEFGGGNNQSYQLITDIANPVVINKSGGTLTFAVDHSFTGDFTYTTGIVDFNGTTTILSGAGPNSINSNALIWNNLSLTGFYNTSLTGNLLIGGNFSVEDYALGSAFNPGSYTVTINGNYSTAGVQGYNTSTFVFNGTTTFYNTDLAQFYNFKVNPGKTLILNTAGSLIEIHHNFTSNGGILSTDTGGDQQTICLFGAQNVKNVSATDIYSAGTGCKTIHNKGGTNTNTENWDLETSARGNFFRMF